jgi:hypothetical protein
LRASAEFQSIAARVADSEPADAWQEDGLHYFVFTLHRNGVRPAPDETPVAVFVMDGEKAAPVSAVMVTPLAEGREAMVVDLREPESGYTASMPRA